MSLSTRRQIDCLLVRAWTSSSLSEPFMKKTFAPLLIVLAGLLLTVQTASATPIASTTFGGQKYDLYAADTVDGLISWAAADLAATAAGGYLAVLTTLEET